MSSVSALLRRAALIEQALLNFDAEEQLAECDANYVAREREALLRILDRIELQLQADLVAV